MFISLTIENVDRLPNGGPLSYSSDGRGFAIGRENRDWNLPDPNLFISGLHCEVRYDRGTFWLYDVSRNGTFVNGSDQRLSDPYPLSHGDRIWIGRYIVAVSIDEGGAHVAGNEWGDWGAPPPQREAPGHPARQPSHAADPFFADTANGQGAAGIAVQPARQPRSQPRAPAQQVAQPPLHAPQLDANELLRLIAAGAGVSPEVFLQRDARDVAAEVGAVLRAVVDELALLLKARAAAKALAKSSQRTMIGGVDNNPLKFIPRSEEILEIMFAQRRSGYLDAKHSVDEAFRDLKTHELATYAAMQAALARLLSELSPDAIERKVPGSSFVSKKSRAWDLFVATWEAREQAHENGMLDVFLAYFSEAYAKSAGKK
ncbi:type VI secretion system-associated FHA domain protein TagH [Aminobacter aganoensis]|uniref:Type VI secretion system protein ImpI n=1 Tax=Aminobacter aganoensis TaxID=83264 RepID=A0A7X0F3I6_9HYPH|nr:type VI secretion system-associated FHA domain protein TagH [Aminobacter aganoensis]MBB6352412.1 type VI secretion system protein ImpI [Aminobacter aganoensis]